ncbi:MAG TPA: right-handed parallel beta-helix repeat-containing protein [Blastocatellia bacterium]|nr:right-handed parallel beta-helix repeat-containing protein [Blastocatellia bacterium]
MRRRIFMIVGVVFSLASVWAPRLGTTAAVQPRTLTVSQTTGAADFTSIQAAINAASPGDTVEIIDSGVYSESLTIPSNKNGLTLRAREGQTPTLTATSSSIIRVFGAENVIIRGLIIMGGTGDGLTTPGAVKNLMIQDCRFEAIPGTAIVLNNDDTATIRTCRLENLGGSGIDLSFGASATIAGNEFRGGPMNGEFSDGIQLTGASADILSNRFINIGRLSIGTFPQSESAITRTSIIRIINNLIVRSGTTIPEGGDGMQIVGSTNTINQFTIVNNTVVNSARFGIGFGFGDAQSRALLANTIVTESGGSSDLAIYSNFSSSLTARQTTIGHCLIGQETRFNSIGRNGNITGDPGFLDPVNDNYRLQESSPAIDKGDNPAIQEFTTDLDGRQRIVDGEGNGTATVDIGAYEFQVAGMRCSLRPAMATNPVGSSHTVTATVVQDGNPVSGAPVTSRVINGPNTGASGSAMTDTMGQASFTYVSNGMAGTDTIQASGSVNDAQFACTATVVWAPPVPPIQYGQTITASIEAPGETDTYSFRAEAGDVVRVRMSRASGSLNPRIQLLDANQRPVREASGFDNVMLDMPLEAGGSFFLSVGDDNGRETGGYGISLQRLNDPVGATSLTFGQNLTASINVAAELDAYSFMANAGDMVRVRMSRSSGSLNPMIELFDSTGVRLAQVSGFDAAILDKTLNSSGTYSLLLSDDNGRETGGYGISLQRLNDPVGATPLNFGQTTTATITAAAEIDAYTFDGRAGQTVTIRMQRTSGSLNPLIELFNAAGTRLQQASAFNDVTLTLTLPTTGRFTILVSDDNGRETGNYQLSLN